MAFRLLAPVNPHRTGVGLPAQPEPVVAQPEQAGVVRDDVVPIARGTVQQPQFRLAVCKLWEVAATYYSKAAPPGSALALNQQQLCIQYQYHYGWQYQYQSFKQLHGA
jgi:hypothetical protein